MKKAIAEGKKEKKILITMNDDGVKIDCAGFDNGLEVIGVLRLLEAQVIESVTGHLTVNASIMDS